MIEGFIKIWEPETGNVLVDKKNAIHYENISIAMANALADRNFGFLQEMHFGNGASNIDSTGIQLCSPKIIGSKSCRIFPFIFEDCEC
jgi:hypothetical protein